MRSMISMVVLAAMLLGVAAVPCLAQPPAEIQQQVKKEPSPGLWQKTLVGGQLGPWFVDDLGNDISTPNTRLDASGTAFHLEFFYQPNLAGVVNLDFSVGAINRGDLRIRGTGYDAFGNATLYPLSAGVIVHPMSKRIQQKFQPLLKAGGSVVVGTEVIEVTTPGVYGTSTESRTALGYYVGGGGTLVLSPSFALTGMVKYQYAKFDKELFEAKDYSGTMVLFGAAYMYR